MTTINKIKAILLGAAIIASVPAAAPATVIAGTSTKGTASVEATMPEFLILHYYSALSLNFATPSSESVDEKSNSMTVSWKGEATGNELATTNLTDAVLELDGNTTTVHIPNAWAVRGVTSNGKAGISVEIPDKGDKMVLDSSVITLSNAQITSEFGKGSSVKVDLKGIAKSNATVGGIDIDLDFTNAKLSGTHQGGQYTITASTI